jgi:hypothetical protein
VQQIHAGAAATSEPDAGSATAEAPRRDKPAAHAETEARLSKPPEPAADEGRGAIGPRGRGTGVDDETADSKGRGLPECPVARSTIEPEVIHIDPRALEYHVTGKTATGKRVDFGSVELKLTPHGDPESPPTMSLQASVFVDGAEHAAHIYDEVVPGPGGHPVGRGARTSLTRYVLDSFGRFYERRFGHPLKAWGGRLAFENKLNFQREYARLTDDNVPPDVVAIEAVKRISYGQHRIAEGFTKLTVHTDQPVPVDLGKGFGIKDVPMTIDVLAEKP